MSAEAPFDSFAPQTTEAFAFGPLHTPSVLVHRIDWLTTFFVRDRLVRPLIVEARISSSYASPLLTRYFVLNSTVRLCPARYTQELVQQSEAFHLNA